MSFNRKSDKIVLEFRNNVVMFLDELIEQFPSEMDLILARMFVKDRIDPNTIIYSFLKELETIREPVKQRDEKTFLNNELGLFNGLNSQKTNRLKVLWKSSVLDDDDRRVIWEWFDTFIYLAETFQKLKLEENKEEEIV